MKRNVDWNKEEDSEKDDYSDKDSDEEPGILKMLLTTSPKPFPEKVLLNCCTVWPLPKISCFGHLAGNYSNISGQFQWQTSQSWSSMCYFRMTMILYSCKGLQNEAPLIKQLDTFYL